MALGDFFQLLAAGDKPAQLDPIWRNLADVQQEAARDNLAVLPQAQRLAGEVNAFRQSELLGMLRKAIPNYDEIQAQIGKNLAAGVRGELSPGTSSALQRITAERAQRGGYAGSQVADWSAAENIGKFTEQVQQEALNSFERWTAGTKANTVPQLFDFTNLFLTAPQRVGVEQDRSLYDFQAATRNAAIEAAPDPFMRALAGALGSTTNEALNLAGTILGSNVTNMNAATGGGGGSGGGGL